MATNLKNLSDYNKENFNLNPDTEVGIVVSEWNSEITDALCKGAYDTLIENGISESNIIIKYVPGSFELPLGAKLMIENTSVDAVICIGCVIQGETRHFDFICDAVANGIMKLNVDTEYLVPVIFGVLTTNNIEQARDRAGGKHGNKGVEAAVSALKMIKLSDDLSDEN